jgi:hypothetical protein
MRELKAGLLSDTDLDVVEIPLHELEEGWIERVDPTKQARQEFAACRSHRSAVNCPAGR